MPKVKQKYIPFIIGSAIAIGIIIGSALNYANRSNLFYSSNSKKEKINRLIDYIDYEYVDAVNTDSIVDVTVNGILSNLDPHSTYIPKEELQEITDNMRGSFSGIGINFYPYKDTIAVIKTTKGGPSERAGILPGDRLLLANNDTIFGKDLNTNTITKKLKGKKNTPLKLTVYRKSENKQMEFLLKRESIPLVSVDASYMLNDNLGYIKLNRFAESTYKEFITSLNQLKLQGATQLALDLRNNPGGLLDVAEQIADEFLSKNKLIVYTKDKKQHKKYTYATAKGTFENQPIYVLINENSASASEVIAGALQDNDQGVIVGRRSFGKGLVQREMALGDGSAVRLTVSRYYTPTGRSIQRPYTNGNSKAYYNDYYKRLGNGELSNSENIKIEDSLKFTTPKGKIVYGGGGIIPDVFVPVDNAYNNETLSYLNRRGYFSYFAFETIDNNRKHYQNISAEEFITNFEVNDTLFKQFEAFVNQQENTNLKFTNYKKAIKQLIKAHLALQLYNDTAFEEIINQHDAMVKEVLVLSKEQQSFNTPKTH